MTVSNEPADDPRVQRVAGSLAGAGNRVEVLCRLENNGKREELFQNFRILRRDQRDPLTFWLDEHVMNPLKRTTLYRRFSGRPGKTPEPERNLPAETQSQAASDLEVMRGIDLFRDIILREGRGRKYDVCHCHDLDTLEAGSILKKEKGCLLVYEAHEMWTEQHFARSAAWMEHFRELERNLIREADLVITVCRSLAREFTRRYDIPEPLVIRSCPPYREVRDDIRGDLRKMARGRPIAYYHGIFITGRGLEDVLEAAARMEEVFFVLRGYGPLEEVLREKIRLMGLEGRVFMAEPVKVQDLVESAAEADIGLMPIHPLGLNSTLCLPNKVFEYLMAGLALLVSDLPEMRRVAKEEGTGEVFRAGSVEDLVLKLKGMISDPEALNSHRRKAREMARTTYNWENEEKKILESYEALLSRGRSERCAA